MKSESLSVILGSDHAGFELKEYIERALEKEKIIIYDYGVHSTDSADYPNIAFNAARAVAEGKFNFGILVCGTGIGMSIVSNKVKGIRAALCTSEYHAEMSRKHNNANIICLGSRVTTFKKALEIIKIFMETEFDDQPRHERRVDQIHKLTES